MKIVDTLNASLFKQRYCVFQIDDNQHIYILSNIAGTNKKPCTYIA